MKKELKIAVILILLCVCNIEVTYSQNTVNTINSPPPDTEFSASSIISYRIPQNAQDSKICIYDLNGKQLQSYPINKSGNGSIIINSHRFNPGIFLYTLIIDKKEIDTKRMIVTE